MSSYEALIAAGIDPGRNVYVMHTTLKHIIADGFWMGFHPEQTIREASNAGYARCVVEPRLYKDWERLNDELHAELDRIEQSTKAL